MTRNLFYSTIAAGSAGLMLLLLIVAGRSLGVADYGAFVYAINIATIAEVFMDFGLHQVTIRAIARDARQAGHMLQTSLALKVLPGAGMVLVFGAVVFVLRPEPAVRIASLILLGSATMRSYVLTARGVLQGLEAFGADAFVTAADRAVLLVACVAALWHGASLIAFCVVFLVARIATALVAVAVARRYVGAGRVDPELWRRLPAEALPIGLFLLILNLYNRVDTVILGRMAGDYATGLYGSAYPLYEGLTYPAAVISAVLAPRLSRLWSTGGPEYGRLVRNGLVGSAALAIVAAAVAWPLAGIALRIFGEGFEPAATSLRWLLIGLPFIYVIWVLHPLAIAGHHNRTLLTVTGIGTVINIVLNLVLIPRYSYNGSAAATVISEGLALAMLLYGLRSALRRAPVEAA